MFNNDLKEKLNNLAQNDGLNPDEDWKSENKQELMSTIVNEQPESQIDQPGVLDKLTAALDLLIPKQLEYALKKGATGIGVLVLAIGGWTGAVQASQSSLPGDTLYNVKVASEQAQLAVTEMVGTKSEKAKLHSKLAKKRAEEVKQIVTNKKKSDNDKTEQTIERMNESISKAQEAITSNKSKQKEKQSNSKQTTKSTQKILENNEVIVDTLSKVLVDTKGNSVKLASEIAIVKGKITKSSLNLLEYMVRGQLEGRVDLSQEEIRALVANTISQMKRNSLEQNLSSSKVEKKALDEITTSVISKVEQKRPDNEQKNNTSTTDKEKPQEKSNSSSSLKNSSSNDQQAESVDSDKEDNEKEKQDNTDSDDKTQENKKETEATSTSKLNTTTDQASSSTTSSIETATNLAQQGQLLKAINKAKNISIQNTKKFKELVQKIEVEQHKDKRDKVHMTLDDGKDSAITTSIAIGKKETSTEEVNKTIQTSSTDSKSKSDATTTKEQSSSTSTASSTKQQTKKGSNTITTSSVATGTDKKRQESNKANQSGKND